MLCHAISTTNSEPRAPSARPATRQGCWHTGPGKGHALSRTHNWAIESLPGKLLLPWPENIDLPFGGPCSDLASLTISVAFLFRLTPLPHSSKSCLLYLRTDDAQSFALWLPTWCPARSFLSICLGSHNTLTLSPWLNQAVSPHPMQDGSRPRNLFNPHERLRSRWYRWPHWTGKETKAQEG